MKEDLSEKLSTLVVLKHVSRVLYLAEDIYFFIRYISVFYCVLLLAKTCTFKIVAKLTSKCYLWIVMPNSLLNSLFWILQRWKKLRKHALTKMPKANNIRIIVFFPYLGTGKKQANALNQTHACRAKCPKSSDCLQMYPHIWGLLKTKYCTKMHACAIFILVPTVYTLHLSIYHHHE